jgi:hypothetical protein
MTVVSRIAISWAAEMTTSGHQPGAGTRCPAAVSRVALVIAVPSVFGSVVGAEFNNKMRTAS